MAHKFCALPDQDVKPVVEWLLSRRKVRHAVIGGELRAELEGAGQEFRSFLLSLQRAGRLFDVEDRPVNEEEAKVERAAEKLGYENVDDCHVIALARLSGSRLLASHDRRTKLHQMFKDRRLLDPPGKIYQRAAHKRLLNDSPLCIGTHEPSR